MSALMWYCAVPAAYHAEASSPLIVRHGKSAPWWPISAARSRAAPSMSQRNWSACRAQSGLVWMRNGTT
jgi:hypothetical protein